MKISGCGKAVRAIETMPYGIIQQAIAQMIFVAVVFIIPQTYIFFLNKFLKYFLISIKKGTNED